MSKLFNCDFFKAKLNTGYMETLFSTFQYNAGKTNGDAFVALEEFYFFFNHHIFNLDGASK